MSTTTPALGPAQVRLGIDLGDERRDVALRADVVVGDALSAALVPVHEPGVVVLDSTGRPLDLTATVGAQLPDGGVVHVVRPAPAPRSRTARWAAGRPDVVSRRPAPEAGLLALGAVVALAASVVVLAGGRPDAPWADVAVALLGLTALVVAASRTPAATAATWAAPTLAFAAGTLVVAPQDGAQARLAVTAGLVCAVVAAGVRLLSTRAARTGDDDAAVVLAFVGVAAGLQAAALLAGWPAATVPTVLVGLAPLALRVAPRLAVSVPDEQLVDLAHVSRTAASVRSPRPRALGRVNERQVVSSVRRAERRTSVATALTCVLTPALAPAVLGSASTGTVPGIGALVLVACVVLAFLLGPRTARGSVARWAPRAAAGALLVEAALLVPVDPVPRLVAAAVAVAVATGVGMLTVAVGRGGRSVVASRLGDTLEGLAVVLSLPAAAVAADAVDILRKVTS